MSLDIVTLCVVIIILLNVNTSKVPRCRRCGCDMLKSDRKDLEPGETFWECPRCDGWQTLLKTPRKHWLAGGEGRKA